MGNTIHSFIDFSSTPRRPSPGNGVQKNEGLIYSSRHTGVKRLLRTEGTPGKLCKFGYVLWNNKYKSFRLHNLPGAPVTYLCPLIAEEETPTTTCNFDKKSEKR